MKKALLILLLCVSFYSCKHVDQNLGETSYYPSFLWRDADTTFTEKTLVLNFSEDAIVSKSFAILQLTDLNHSQFDSKLIQIMVDNEFVKRDFRVSAKSEVNPQEVNLKIRFLPDEEEGIHYGFLRVQDHNLDRIDDTMLNGNESADIFQWQINFQKKMNPLKKTLLIVVVLMLLLLLIWMLLLKRMFYPVFPRFRKQVKIATTGVQTVVFTGCREVHFTNVIIKQTRINTLFKGKISYVNSPEFTSAIVFKPYKQQARASYKSADYRFSNNPVPKDGVTEIINYQTKNTITIN